MTLIADIWRSFRAMPLWVRVWVALWLVPVNPAAFLLLAHRIGAAGAVAAALAMGPNLAIMAAQRGFGKAMALPHLAPWTVLAIWLALELTGGGAPGGAVAAYGWILLATNAVSLAFDYVDAVKWLRGDRAPAGRSRTQVRSWPETPP